MTRSIVLKTAGVVLAASVLLGGGLFGLRFDTPPEVAAAPVPKEDERPKPEEVPERIAELLVIPAVQRELKLSPEQRVGLIDGLDRLTEELEKAVGPGVSLERLRRPEWENGGVSADAAASFKKYGKGVRELLASTLTKAQFTRLQQCEVQVLGPHAVMLKRVAGELNLTDAQKRQVDQLAQAIAADATEDVELPKVGPNGVQIPRREQADKAFAELVNGFSQDQAKWWKGLTGEKVGFDLQRVRERHPLPPPADTVVPDVGDLPGAATAPALPGGLPVPPMPVKKR